MAKYRITSPDGGVYEISAPDDASEAEVLDYAKANMNKPDVGGKSTAPNPYENKSAVSQFLLGTGNAVFDQARGAGQLIRDVVPNRTADALGLPNAVDVENARIKNTPLYDTGGGAAGEMFGRIAPALLLPSQTITQSALTGGMLGAIEQRGKGESLAGNIAKGAGGGAAGSFLVSAAGRALKPVRTEAPKSIEKLVKKAENYGITLSPGQITGSPPIRWIESVMADLPMTAGKQMAFNQAQHNQFNRALSKTMGENADKIGEDVMAHAKKRIGGGIGDLAERNKLNVDYDFLFGLAENKMAASSEYPEHIIKAVNKYADDLMKKVDSNGNISGKAYRTFDTDIGTRIRNTSDGDLKYMLGKLRDEARSAMDRSISAADKAEWKTLRRQYANMKKLEPLAAKSTSGDISPELVTAAAIKKDSNAAYRTSDLKELGKVGKQFLKPLPSSGTAQRNFYTKMLTSPVNAANLLGGGAGYFAGGPGGAALGGLLSTALTSGAAAVPLQALMMSQAGKKYLSEGILQGLQAYSPIAHRMAAPVGAYGILSMTANGE